MYWTPCGGRPGLWWAGGGAPPGALLPMGENGPNWVAAAAAAAGCRTVAVAVGGWWAGTRNLGRLGLLRPPLPRTSLVKVQYMLKHSFWCFCAYIYISYLVLTIEVQTYRKIYIVGFGVLHFKTKRQSTYLWLSFTGCVFKYNG